jgi:hypothetical protein
MMLKRLMIRMCSIVAISVSSATLMAKPAHAAGDSFGCYDQQIAGCFCLEVPCTEGGKEYRYYCECVD